MRSAYNIYIYTYIYILYDTVCIYNENVFLYTDLNTLLHGYLQWYTKDHLRRLKRMPPSRNSRDDWST